MEPKFFRAKIRGIEEEIRVLKAQLGPSGKGVKRFSDLEGLWKGKADFSFEEIQEAEIKLKA